MSVLIPNLNGLTELKACIPSVLKQSGVEKEVVVVDNGSRDGSVDYLRAIPSIKIVSNERNLGFAKAVNQAVNVSTGENLFILNNDTTLAPKCISNLVKELDTLRSRNKHVAGVQPKILFHEFPTIIDAIGTGINRDGTGFNIGVGQVDLGQFDKTMRIFGLCFAAAFIDRKVFDAVGALPENYFAYYEDIDWCYRANSQGYEFRSAPQAVVYHRHSATSRRVMEYDEKRYLLARNRLRTILRNFRGRNLIRAARPIAGHLFEIYNTVRHPLSRSLATSLRQLDVNIRVLASLASTPILLHQNAMMNPRRSTTDSDIWQISAKLQPYAVKDTFYDAAHAPIINLGTIRDTYALAARVLRSKELSNKSRALTFARDLLGKRKWLLANPDELSSNSRKGFRLNNFMASAAGETMFIVKQSQNLVIDPFLLDLLLSFRGRTRSEVVSHLAEKMQSVLPPDEDKDSLNEISGQCVSIFATHFLDWGLISKEAGN